MRFAALALALAAFVFAFQDFVQRTWPLLGRDRAALEEHLRVVDDHLARGEARGAPPSVQEVTHARELARAWHQDRIEHERTFFAGAARASDYLLPPHRRPAVDGLAEQRTALEQLLLALPAELKAFAGASPERLGLEVPSLSGGLSEDERRVADQVARSTALVRVLAAAHAVPNFVARDLAFERVAPATGGERLVLKIGGEAPLADAVQFFELVLGDAADAPPRRLESFTLRRVPPTEWGAAARRLPSPPVRIELRVGFEPVGDERRAAPKGVPK